MEQSQSRLKVLQSVYGLLLETPLPVPGLQLQAERRDEDVRVHVRGVLAEGEFPFPITAQNFFYASPTLDDKGLPLVRAGWDTKENYFGFWYSDGAKFAVSREGCEIWADWPDGYTLEDACTYLVGPVLAFALRLRGATCLHASAIEVDGLAIALVGAPGAGKSTTAAAFALAGFPVLSDDIVVLSETNGRLFVQPGYPRVNVWPDSARALTGSAAALPLITPTWGKHFLPLGQNGLRFAGRPLPLGAVYLLAERQPELAAPVVEEISGSEAMVTLAANTYQNYLLDAEMRRKDFELFERLAKALPVRRIRRPDDISALASSCEAIAADARRMLARGIANEVPAGD